jgi:hypothetical protein
MSGFESTNPGIARLKHNTKKTMKLCVMSAKKRAINMPSAHLFHYAEKDRKLIASLQAKSSDLYEFSDGLNCCLLHFRSPSLQKEQRLNKYRDAVGWVVGALLDSLCIQTS